MDEITKNGLEKDFDFNNAYPYVQMLKDQIEGKNNSWAIRWFASCCLNNKLCLYPSKSFVENIGFGIEGATHCAAATNYFDVNLYNKPLNLLKIKTEEKKENRKLFEKYFKSIVPKKSGNFLFKKEKDGNRRTITILGFIKISYKKKKSKSYR